MSDLQSHTEIRLGSDRSFGVVMGAVFAAIAAFPMLDAAAPRWWAVVPALTIWGLAGLAPARLHPANRLWFRFGLLLNRVVSPVVMGVIFFGTILPTGLVLRASRRGRARETGRASYWIEVPPENRGVSSMRNQF